LRKADKSILFLRIIEGETDLANSFSTLELKILTAKGLTAAQLEAMSTAGVAGKEDLKVVGDVTTLRELIPDLDAEVAERVMGWASGQTAAPATPSVMSGGKMLLDTADIVYCAHCSAKQPKDYKSGDLCIACGRQAEPILTCFWCSASGPGTFCRSCGAKFVPPAELDLGLLLKHEGLPKEEVPKRLEAMSQPDKDLLWGRVRRHRG
jgi:hypothetical protein